MDARGFYVMAAAAARIASGAAVMKREMVE
jgi:hypothetical protein